ncbi:uncharacterized protein LOC119694538 isoform X3 [Plutella xylostella]|uniref:uncharacterized protein LOC119694538 isoform X3 n=1 Tax=Plutella xylostella TaxID=51655 RepID=UPI0005D0B3A9|nr:uncharacterized protein LOC119694538 isoform X3 [Plutella xylostella]
MEDTDRKSAIARRAYYKGAITKQKAKLQQENLNLASAEMLKLKEAKLIKIYARALALESSNVRDNTVKDREVNMRAGSTLQVSQAKTTHVAVDASCNFCDPAAAV